MQNRGAASAHICVRPGQIGRPRKPNGRRSQPLLCAIEFLPVQMQRQRWGNVRFFALRGSAFALRRAWGSGL